MNDNRKIISVILSLFLTAVMLFTTFAELTVYADGEETSSGETAAETAADESAENAEDAEDEQLLLTADEDEGEEDTEEDPSLNEDEEGDPALEGNQDEEGDPNAEVEINRSDLYLNKNYATAEEKLRTMELKVSAYGYELYCDEYSGELAYVDTKTGRMEFTNPFDVATSPSTSDVKNQLLSQLILRYSETSSGTEKEMYSFKEAAVKDQIIVKNLKNGVRVEYALGDEETRYLVPMVIEKSRFEENIYDLIKDQEKLKGKFDSYYHLFDPFDKTISEREIKNMNAKYPITEQMAVYVFDTTAAVREIKQIEKYVKENCPEYTFADLEEDHALTNYVNKQKAPALFRMALEYYLDEQGLQVRLPANGIRFDEDEYKLLSVRVLPYFGAGSSDYEGYTFLPDGSGALFDFQELKSKSVNITGKVYGTDFSYLEIGTVKSKNISVPVYGVVEHYVGNVPTFGEVTIPAHEDEETGEEIPETVEEQVIEYTPITQDRGFVAIIEEGDSLASMTTSHGGTLHRYNSVYAEFYPRPTDSYNLSQSMSVGDDTVWTVTSKKKYTGSYRIRMIILTDDATAQSAGMDSGDYYEVSWKGMARAYRDYLESTGVFKKKENVTSDIPLYIESFGAIDTDSTFLTIPTTKKVPLTTFDNVKEMYEDLSENGIKNINFRLTGFTNGGMKYTTPYKVEFEKCVGGNKGYSELVEYAKSKGFAVFPDFDFEYLHVDKAFDGFSYKKDAAKTIDGRYTTKRIYDPAFQAVYTTGLTVISPSAVSKMYAKVSEKLGNLGFSGISASTLGSDLNSDFSKKKAYNREDAKQEVQTVLEQMQNDTGNVMVDSGNAFTWKYVDHIINVNLDSSRYNNSSKTVPFVGMVLHGYVNFAGTPTNMASDMNYETLKMLENGALPYFTLSYQNTPLLKEDYTLSQYYSVAYDIWSKDILTTYKTLNDLLKDVQDSRIEDHEFLNGVRIPEEDELLADEKLIEDAAKQLEEQAEASNAKAERAKKYAERKGQTYIDNRPADQDKTPNIDTTSKYEVTDGSIVRVTYENGLSYILNYNNFDVEVDGQKIEALSYLRED
ncbi:MAG: hypothetical protein IJT91_07120 [Clostridia bacterium]|nr:hypothetical protein [Clostridia bacterium]